MQLHDSKYCTHRHHPPDPWVGSIGQNSTFSEHGHVAYQIKGNHQVQQHGSKCFSRRRLPVPRLCCGSKCQNLTFSEHCHVAYQIKENHECSNMVANIMPADPLPSPPDPWWKKRSKLNFFRTWSCCMPN